MIAATAIAAWLLTSAHAPSARLCVTRPEQNGYLNIVPIQLLIDRRTQVLGGGEAACLDMAPGPHAVHLAWRWDERDPTSRDYRSATADIRLAAGEVRRLTVCPAPAAPSGAPRWTLSETPCPKL
jgi:hypothetical protein